MLLCWGEGQVSSIHSHANAHCFLKVMDGTLMEHMYNWPMDSSSSEEQTMDELRTMTYGKDQVTYICGKVVWALDFFVPRIGDTRLEISVVGNVASQFATLNKNSARVCCLSGNITLRGRVGFPGQENHEKDTRVPFSVYHMTLMRAFWAWIVANFIRKFKTQSSTLRRSPRESANVGRHFVAMDSGILPKVTGSGGRSLRPGPSKPKMWRHHEIERVWVWASRSE
jgi:hypothetical protein